MAQEEAENTLLRAVCRRDGEEEAIQQGVGHKGACDAPSKAWKIGEIPIILQWNPLSAHPQSQVWLALSGLELIQNQLPSHPDVGCLISGPEGSRGVEWRMASSDSRGVGWRVAPRGSRSQTKR